MTSGRTEFNSVRNIPLRQNWSVNQNITAYKTASQIGGIARIGFGILFAVLIMLIYLMMVTNSGSLGYNISDEEKISSELLAQNQDLQVESARLQALATVKGSTVATTMTDPVSVDTQE